jgi:hypothetical protein
MKEHPLRPPISYYFDVDGCEGDVLWYLELLNVYGIPEAKEQIWKMKKESNEYEQVLKMKMKSNARKDSKAQVRSTVQLC